MREFDFPLVMDNTVLQAAVEHIAHRSVALAQTVLGRTLDLDTICLFAHSAEEYAFVEQAVRARGPVSKFSHGPTLYVDVDLMMADWHIRMFGVRAPDPNRPWRGYGDFPVDDYAALVQSTVTNPYIREITSGRGQPLLELKHPDFDVLGFVVQAKDHH
ncbi:MAG TPA: hypothetical protein VJP80_05230 [Candidatus Saccharimonadales bacterium]|nr:hypothetical protein [Candidatus Saccharimonadales bacterium]